jgi:serine/threonine-protein kinase
MVLADLMLLEVLARGHGSLLLGPGQGEDFDLVFHGEKGASNLGIVPEDLANATLMRLALIGGQNLAPPQVERLQIRLASHQGAPDARKMELLMSLRPAARGNVAELYALAGARNYDDVTLVSGIEGLSELGSRQAKYEVVDVLGKGGMGIVYLARHVSLDKQVALKVLSPAMAQRQVLAAQFMVEARAACRARHPAIIDVTDFGRLSDGRNFLVMEHVGWPTLSEALRDGPLGMMRALRVARSIAEGVAAAHAHGVVHRDLKPANIFITPEDQVKIADFGLAQTAEVDKRNSGIQGICFGTVPYMPPEQSLGQGVDHRADIYAFGCILFELLTGDTPYASEDSEEVLKAHRETAIPDLPEDCRRSASLVQLQRELLGKTPSERPNSLEAVIVTLDRCMEELA